MPVDKNVRALERRSARIKSVANFKIAFQLEIELLGKIAGQIDSCAAQTKPIFQGRLTKASLERGDIAIFESRQPADFNGVTYAVADGAAQVLLTVFAFLSC